MKKVPFGLWLLGAVTVAGVLSFAGCGSDEENGNDNPSADGGDATTDTIAREDAFACVDLGVGCTVDTDCCSGSCEPATKKCARIPGKCTPGGEACKVGPDCCTFACVGGICSSTQCIADGQACTQNEECCGGTCEGGTCKPLNLICKSQGNPCGGNDECCSKYCKAGICSAPTFCAQLGDACTADVDCCGGLCAKPDGGAGYGTCAIAAGPSGGCNPAGTVCTGDGCDNKCCSKSCGPDAVTGISICQPPSGCKPKYEVCKTDDDCCGGPNQPQGANASDTVTCAPSPRPDPYGRCDKAEKCNPPGDTCKVDGFACGIDNRCCEPVFPDGGAVPPSYCQNNPDHCCSFDVLGIPRCHAVAVGCNAGAIPEGTLCASSADCCGKPCVNNKCGSACVPSGGGCTSNADCCAGTPCNIEPGSTKGTCGGTTNPGGTDGGTTTPCSAYGQTCSATQPCCNGVPCTNGVCIDPVR